MRAIEWKNDAIRIIDQTELPFRLKYLYIKDIGKLIEAIKSMRIRGAPALGVAAALGLYLGIRKSGARNFSKFFRQLERIARLISSSRPTAQNLFWALERILKVAEKNNTRSIPQVKRLIFEEALRIIQEDRVISRKIGAFGERLIRDDDRILTICNTGILATIDFGTALGVIYSAYKKGKRPVVFCCETRPALQGARLTSWELLRKGVKAVLICDNAAASLMKQGSITKVMTGADRIALNGDTANKIGTYNLAVLANYHKIPFFVVAPHSTFDPLIKTGNQIIIEQRSPQEVTHMFFKKAIAPEGIKVFNPAFDITSYKLITAFITDKGVIRPPFMRNIKKILKDK